MAETGTAYAAGRRGEQPFFPKQAVIDIHAHILPGLDDGAQTMDEAVQMARLATADGIRTMVATPHLFPRNASESRRVNDRETVLRSLARFREKLQEEEVELEVIPGCDLPLSPESLQMLEEGQALTVNDANRYLLLELPGTSIPPALEEIVFRLQSRGLTPVITHPERHFIFQEMPAELARLLHLGCLAQVTGHSLVGGFGRSIAAFARKLVKMGYVQVLASDAHDAKNRPPVLAEAVREVAALVGPARARAMVEDWPERIVKGEPWR